MAATETSERPSSAAIASKERFFFFLPSKRVGEEAGRREMREVYRFVRSDVLAFELIMMTDRDVEDLPRE